MKQNVPFAPQQYFDLSGLPADGGWIWVYLKGTSTPATSAIWFDADGLVAGSNPVVLDSAGRPETTGAFYLDAGGYTLKLYRADGAQLGAPVDVIVYGATFAGGSETVNQGIAIIVKTYADVRGLTGSWDAVYTAGRAAEGDGGEGWFQRRPTESGADDDGICLVAGSNRYIRVFDAEILPAWFGLVYGSGADQTTAFAKCLTASLRWRFPVGISGDVYLAQDADILDGQSLTAHRGGRVHASTGATVVVTFRSGSRLSAQGETFGVGLSPKFEENVIEVAHLSWMGGAVGDDKVTKLTGCTSGGAFLTAVIDATMNVSVDIIFPANIAVDVVGGRFDTLTQIDVTIPVFIYSGTAAWLVYGDASHVGGLDLGGRVSFLEWFGATGDGVADDSIPWAAGVRHARIHLLGKYLVPDAVTAGPTLELLGDLVAAVGLLPGDVSEMPASSVIFSGSGTRLTIPANGIMSGEGIGIAFDDPAGEIVGNLSNSSALLDGCVVFSDSVATVFDLYGRYFNGCSFTSKALIGSAGSSLNYTMCAFAGAFGVSSTVQVDKVLTTEYLVPPSSGAIPPLVCRPSDKSVQLASPTTQSILLENISFGAGDTITGSSHTIGAMDKPLTIFTGTGPIDCDLPDSTEMAANPEAPRVRVIVFARTASLAVNDWVNISNASTTCWWNDSAANVRVPARGAYTMGSIFVWATSRWAQL